MNIITGANRVFVTGRPIADSQTTPMIKDDEVLVKFQDCSVIYKKEQIVAFKTLAGVIVGKEITLLQNFPLNLFNIIKAVVLEKQYLHDVLSTKDYENPFLREELFNLLALLQPANSPWFVSVINSAFNVILTLEQADMVCRGFEAAVNAKDERLKTWNPPENVRWAKFVKVRAEVFFPDKPEEASRAFRELQQAYREIEICEQHERNVKKALENPKNNAQVQILNGTLSALHEQISTCRTLLRKIESKIDIERVKLSFCVSARKYKDSDDPMLANLAWEAEKRLKVYSELIIGALRKSGADMKRQDLLNYLVGPNDYLFDYYGLAIMNSGLHSNVYSNNTKYPFSHPQVQEVFGYHLENPTPYDLEEEIRKDLSDHPATLPLPPRRIDNPKREREFTAEEKQLQKDIIPFLIGFPYVSDEQMLVIANLLIEYNQWEKYGIRPEDLKITKCEKSSEDMYKVEGNVKIGFNKIEKLFRFNSDNFILLIPRNEDHATPDKISTEEEIKSIINDRQGRYLFVEHNFARQPGVVYRG